MLKTKKIFIFIFIICFMSSAFLSCSREQKEFVEEGKLTVVGSGGYPPFNFYEGNEVVGFDVDTGKAIAKRLGLELNYLTSDWDGLLEGLRTGYYDGILGSMAITEQRKERVNFTIPYYYSGAQLVVTKNSEITSLSEMKDKTIAVSIGTTFGDDAKNLGAKVVPYQDDNQTLTELLNGRVDGVITDRLVAIRAKKEMNRGDELVLAGGLLRLEEMAIAVRQDNTELLKKLNKVLTVMHEDGTLSEISSKWHAGTDITKK